MTPPGAELLSEEIHDGDVLHIYHHQSPCLQHKARDVTIIAIVTN